MAINVANEPNQLGMGLLQFLAGFGQQKRLYEQAENKRQQEISQNRANAVGGAIGDAGQGYFQGKTRRFELDELNRRIAQQSAYRMAETQNLYDLKTYGMPSRDIDIQAAQSDSDPWDYRRALSRKNELDALANSHLDYYFEPGLSPANERRFRELQDAEDKLYAAGSPQTPEEEATFYEALSNIREERKKVVQPEMVPRKQPKPTTWDQLVEAGIAIEEDVPGGKIVKTPDRNGAYRIEHIKYDKSQDEAGLTMKDYLTLEMDARDGLTKKPVTKADPESGVETLVSPGYDPSQEEVDAAVMRAVQRKQQINAMIKAGAIESGAPPQQGQPMPQQQQGQGPQQPPVQLQPPPQGPQFFGTPEMAYETIQGINPAQITPEMKEQLRPAAELVQSDLIQKFGNPPQNVPSEMLQVLVNLKAILE